MKWLQATTSTTSTTGTNEAMQCTVSCLGMSCRCSRTMFIVMDDSLDLMYELGGVGEARIMTKI